MIVFVILQEIQTRMYNETKPNGIIVPFILYQTIQHSS